MFDYHMHSHVSFDGHDSGLAMALAAKAVGLKEICFTDHIDHDCDAEGRSMVFDTAAYNAEYDGSEYFGKTIRIFGHCESTHDTLKWLLGLDGNGSATWDIELKRGNQEIAYPTAKSGTVNPVEIVGRLATYEENGIIYACITVDKISRVESVFK